MLAKVEDTGLARLLKTLERSWRAVEDSTYSEEEALKAKPEATKTARSQKKAVKSGKKGGRKAGKKSGACSSDAAEEGDECKGDYDPTRPQLATNGTRRRSSRSRSPATRTRPETDAMDFDELGQGDFWTEDAQDHLQRASRYLSDALIAVRACLLILTSTRLTKHLYVSDTIASMTKVLRDSLDLYIVPLLEAATNSHLDDLVQLESNCIATVTQALELAIEPLSNLIRQEELPEEIVTSAFYLALDPFFHDTPPPATGRGGKKRVSSLARAIAAIRTGCLDFARTLWVAIGTDGHGRCKECSTSSRHSR